MSNMIVKDGAGASKYIGSEGAGSDVDPYVINRVLVGGYKRLKCEFTRPANTTAYSALDCLGDNAPSITTQLLAEAGRINGGHGAIVRAVMKTDNLSWTNPISVVIYDGDGPASFIADNSAFDVKYADAGDVVGVLNFGSFAKDATGAAGSLVKATLEGLNLPYECGAAVDDLYFQCFLPSGTPTPASGQKFYLNFGVIRD